MKPASKSRVDNSQDSSSTAVPPGAPTWITEELIEKTLETWQPYYSYRLTRDDAVVIIKNVGKLFDVMAHGGD